MGMRKFGFFAAGALTLALGSSQPALAADFDEILRTVLTTVTTGNLPYTTSSVGTSIDGRQTQLESQVTAGVTTGQLTVDEAADLRNRLSSITSLKSTYLADGTLNYSETRNLLDQLTDVSRRLEIYLSNESTVGDVGVVDHRLWFSRFGARPLSDGTLPNESLRRAHIDSYQAELSARIEQGAVDGRLDWNEAAELRRDLNSIASDESIYLGDGRLSFDEETKLRNALVALDDKSKRELRDFSRANSNRYHRRGHARTSHHYKRGVDRRQSVLRDRIDAGLKSGRLTATEASKLYAKEAQISTMEARLRSDGSGLNWREERSIMNRLDNLAKQINRELFDRQVR